MLVEFVSVVDAVRCAVDIQRGMEARNAAVPAENRIEFRIGINVGDIISDGGDIYGDGVNLAARLEALAEPGGIYVSRVVRDQVRDKLSFGFDDLGEQISRTSRIRSGCTAFTSRRMPPSTERSFPAQGPASRRSIGHRLPSFRSST